MEATDQYGWHIAHYLQDQLKGYEPDVDTKVYVLNARRVARFKKGYDTLPKNDKIDAWVIADHLRFGRLPREMREAITTRLTTINENPIPLHEGNWSK